MAIEGFRGVVLGPQDEGYEAARRVWNGAIDRRPRLVARCTGTADVAAAIRFAAEHDLLVAVRGGGHGVAGPAVCDDGIVIDCSPMRGVRVRTASARPGADRPDPVAGGGRRRRPALLPRVHHRRAR